MTVSACQLPCISGRVAGSLSPPPSVSSLVTASAMARSSEAEAAAPLPPTFLSLDNSSASASEEEEMDDDDDDDDDDDEDMFRARPPILVLETRCLEDLPGLVAGAAALRRRDACEDVISPDYHEEALAMRSSRVCALL